MHLSDIRQQKEWLFRGQIVEEGGVLGLDAIGFLAQQPDGPFDAGPGEFVERAVGTDRSYRSDLGSGDGYRHGGASWDSIAQAEAKAMLDDAQNLSMSDRERLFGYLEGSRKLILVEPQSLLTEASRLPGLDGQKMSKSYGNTIALRDDSETVTKKIRTMPTDPARVRRTDPGDPDKCPVWQFHQVYSDTVTKEWVVKGCKSAGIGCLECKQPVIDAILKEQEPMRERAQQYLDDPSLVRAIVADGCDVARKHAQDTMRDVREEMGLSYN